MVADSGESGCLGIASMRVIPFLARWSGVRMNPQCIVTAQRGFLGLPLEFVENYRKRNWIVTARCIGTGLPWSVAG